MGGIEMVKEDYVSFETAKLLKEKGFDWASKLWYNNNGIVSRKYIEPTNNILGKDKHFPCITIQMAMKWLREVHNIFIHISITQESMYDSINELVFGEPEYNYKIEHLYSYEENYGRESYDSYEEACEAAIKYCLTNLI